jgi:hypothetical protein
MTESRARVFISYAREDHEAASRLYKDLRQASSDPWLDTKSLLPGQRWRVAISAAIRNSQYFLALLSSKSVSKRGYVQKELKEALELLDEIPESQIFIIPARLDECFPSHERLHDIQWADLFPSWDDGISKILLAMQITSANSIYNIVPDELETYILNHVDISKFERRSSYQSHYSEVVYEFDGDDFLYIFWDNKGKRLVKYYRSYSGVRWYGPERLTEGDKRKVMQVLGAM